MQTTRESQDFATRIGTLSGDNTGRVVYPLVLQRDLYAKFGGVHFKQTAPTQDINEFVRSLPESKRDNLFEVLQELDHVGLIAIQNDGHWLNPYGETHPTQANESIDTQ